MLVNTSNQFVVFSLAGQRYALRLSTVERIVRAAAVTDLPMAPLGVVGVIDLQGRIVPVVSLRRRFRLPEREIVPDDAFIVATTAYRTVALVVDSVIGVVARQDKELTLTSQILPKVDYIEGVVKLPDGLALIHDLERLLSLDEAKALDDALSKK